MDFQQAKLKAANYCTYQERTQGQVRQKLYQWGLKTDMVEHIITDLITENFINEERYAISYAGGKFRMKKWGRLKIEKALQQQQLSPYCIHKALEQIDAEAYNETLTELMHHKNNKIREPDIFIKRQKVATFLIGKGYEPDLVWDLLKDAISS
ncbi:MAG: regulatory protein RecX [Candidatus Cyclobacteriaceae bacterium M3_2C_046]